MTNLQKILNARTTLAEKLAILRGAYDALDSAKSEALDEFNAVVDEVTCSPEPLAAEVAPTLREALRS